MSHPANTLQSGYEKFVIKNAQGCWGWKGCAPKNPGYGQFRYKMKLIRAHQASWKLHKGDIPDGVQVLHRCDNRICSRPEHLFLGTRLDNIRDMMMKKRHPTLGKKGSDNVWATLTEEKVKLIRKLYADERLNFTYEDLAGFFGVHKMTIGSIVRKEHWKGVS